MGQARGGIGLAHKPHTENITPVGELNRDSRDRGEERIGAVYTDRIVGGGMRILYCWLCHTIQNTSK